MSTAVSSAHLQTKGHELPGKPLHRWRHRNAFQRVCRKTYLCRWKGPMPYQYLQFFRYGDAQLLAGMPTIIKPATSISYVAQKAVEIIARILPEGALQIICGSAGDLFDHLSLRDVVTFTGSHSHRYPNCQHKKMSSKIRSLYNGGRFP